MNEIIKENKEKWFSLLTSRRAQAVIVGILVVIFQEALGMSQMQAAELAGLIMAWVIGDTIRKT